MESHAVSRFGPTSSDTAASRLGGRIFLIAGGPGVGKSTTARALADTYESSIHIDVDQIRHSVRGGLVLPGFEWSAELRRQIRLARETTVDMARRYAGEGFTVVIDDFWDVEDLAEYNVLSGPAVHRVLLYPSQDEARRRNRVRSPGEEGDMIDAAIPFVYEHYGPRVEAMRADGWRVIESTGLDVGSVVDQIREATRGAAA